MFEDMMNVVHIIEKLFCSTLNNHKYYLVNEERDPYRTTTSNRFETKVIFICLVAIPLCNTRNNYHFNGKIGIYPFTACNLEQHSI